jgi:hypothetical protein
MRRERSRSVERSAQLSATAAAARGEHALAEELYLRSMAIQYRTLGRFHVDVAANYAGPSAACAGTAARLRGYLLGTPGA